LLVNRAASIKREWFESYRRFKLDLAELLGDLVYSFRFIADGSHMAMGIIQVIYADHQTMSLSS
jgi:hypothetical protein